MQIISWILGEYSASLNDSVKITKIIDLLCNAAYGTYEDDITRGYILTAITKLHAAIGFPENPIVEHVMRDYQTSRHLNVQ
jgi:hypothetical protein